MKYLFCILAAVVVGCCIASPKVDAQENTAVYGKEAFSRLHGHLNLAAKQGFGIQSKEGTIFGGWLPKGMPGVKSKWYELKKMNNLDPNKVHRVIVAGDFDAKDVDVEILNRAGNVVASDTRVGREAIATFRPVQGDEYRIRVRLFNSRDNCVIIGTIMSK